MPILLTERAKKILRLAQYEAFVRGQSMIQLDHLRLALLVSFDADTYLELAGEGFSLDVLEGMLIDLEDSLPRFTSKIPLPEMYLAPETQTFFVRAAKHLRGRGYLHLTPRVLFYFLFEK
jgi:ATP-dependent Clp protease ATP-binding subunit ClpA